MKTKDIPMLEKQVLDMLPLTQAEVWKKLKIGSRSGSGLIKIMLEHKLVKRTVSGGTYLIEKLNGSGNKKEIKFDILLSKGGNFSPCCGCSMMCDPEKCTPLTEWILG